MTIVPTPATVGRRHTDRTIRTFGDLVTGLRDTIQANSPVWFRGQGHTDWKLTPTLARAGKLDAELTLIKRFKQSAAPYISLRPQPGSAGEWEWIFLMQHHRAPTRLLDWTESPIVGLYFAVEDTKHDKDSSALWCLDPIALNKKAGHNRTYALDILAFGIDEALNNYLPDKLDPRTALLNPVAAIGPRNSARMVAQAGTFTVIHAESKPVEDVDDGQHIWRFIIPPESRPLIREELRLLGITEHSLFPDLDRVAKLVGDLV